MLLTSLSKLFVNISLSFIFSIQSLCAVFRLQIIFHYSVVVAKQSLHSRMRQTRPHQRNECFLNFVVGHIESNGCLRIRGNIFQRACFYCFCLHLFSCGHASLVHYSSATIQPLSYLKMRAFAAHDGGPFTTILSG